MNIAIIDDRITSNYILSKNTTQFYVNCDLEIKKVNNIFNQTINDDTHADICAKIIRKYNPNCKIINIIVKESFSGSLDRLITGLDFVSKTEEIDIVNMSIGFTEKKYAPELYKIVKEICNDKIIVSAYSNDGKITYPAAFKGVIGCKAIKSNNDYTYYKQNGIYYTLGTHIIRLNSGKPFFTPNVNSYATAYITALISNNKLTV